MEIRDKNAQMALERVRALLSEEETVRYFDGEIESILFMPTYRFQKIHLKIHHQKQQLASMRCKKQIRKSSEMKPLPPVSRPWIN